VLKPKAAAKLLRRGHGGDIFVEGLEELEPLRIVGAEGA